MWDGGFERFYGPNFFLSDVGAFGTVFRYGLLGIILIFLFYAFCFKTAFRAPSTIEVRAGRLYLLMLIPLNVFIPVIEFLGSTTVIPIAIFLWETAAQRQSQLGYLGSAPAV